MPYLKPAAAAAILGLLLAVPVAGRAARADAGATSSTGATPKSWSAENITVSDVWTRMPAKRHGRTAVHLKITNHTGRDTKLIIVESPDADRTAMQLTVNGDTGGMAKSQPVPALDVPNGETRTFKPTGRHVAMIGLKQTYRAGDTMPLTLTFLEGQELTVAVRVRPAADNGNGGGSGASDATSSGG